MNRKPSYVLLLAAMILIAQPICAQESSKVAPTIDFTYLKRTDGSKLLQAKVYLFQNRKTYLVVNQDVLFSAGGDSITRATTDGEGIAYLLIQPGAKLKENPDGTTTFKVNYPGKDTLDAANAEITVRDMGMAMHLEVLDSVRTVHVKLFETGKKGDTIPVSGQTVDIYVHRMLSLQKIGEETTGDNGELNLEFPRDLPGESDGSVTVVARVEENEKYGNVENSQVKDWGIPVDHSVVITTRALWTQIAPWWMIITLTILLTGVWGHYIYVIVQLVMIKKDGNKPVLK